MKAILIIAPILIFAGCAAQSPEIVYVPVKCEIEMRKRPAFEHDKPLSQNVVNVLKYTELIESDLKFCITGKVNF